MSARQRTVQALLCAALLSGLLTSSASAAGLGSDDLMYLTARAGLEPLGGTTASRLRLSSKVELTAPDGKPLPWAAQARARLARLGLVDGEGGLAAAGDRLMMALLRPERAYTLQLMTRKGASVTEYLERSATVHPVAANERFGLDTGEPFARSVLAQRLYGDAGLAAVPDFSGDPVSLRLSFARSLVLQVLGQLDLLARRGVPDAASARLMAVFHASEVHSALEAADVASGFGALGPEGLEEALAVLTTAEGTAAVLDAFVGTGLAEKEEDRYRLSTLGLTVYIALFEPNAKVTLRGEGAIAGERLETRGHVHISPVGTFFVGVETTNLGFDVARVQGGDAEAFGRFFERWVALPASSSTPVPEVLLATTAAGDVSSLGPAWPAGTVARDANRDGRPDAWFVDANGNGVFERIEEDSDYDGTVDFIKQNRDDKAALDSAHFLTDSGWQQTNLIEAWLELNFDLPSSYHEYTRHNLEVLLNGHRVATLADTVPEGRHAFRVPPAYLKYAGGMGGRQNEVTLVAHLLRGGHYVVAYDFHLRFRLTEIGRYVVASTQEEADRIVQSMEGITSGGRDASISATDLVTVDPEVISGQPVTIRAEVSNTGEEIIEGLKVALFDGDRRGPQKQLQLVTIPRLGLYLPEQVELSWEARPGVHTLWVVLDPEDKVEENSEDNNRVSRTFKGSGEDQPPSLAVSGISEGAKLDVPRAEVTIRSSDDWGIERVEYAIDSEVWATLGGDEVVETAVFVPAGRHRVRFRAVDTSGQAVEVAFSVECTARAPELTATVAATSVDCLEVSIEGTASDDHAIMRVEARSSEGFWKEIPVEPVRGYERHVKFAGKVDLVPGQQDVVIRVTDAKGLSAEQVFHVTCTADYQAPRTE